MQVTAVRIRQACLSNELKDLLEDVKQVLLFLIMQAQVQVAQVGCLSFKISNNVGLILAFVCSRLIGDYNTYVGPLEGSSRTCH